jgi:hypothetical protein
MRPRVLSLLLFVLIIPSLSGCNANQDEAVTLTLDYASKTNEAFCDKLIAQFPEIHFAIDYYRGRNPGGAILQKLEHDDESDIVITPSLPTVSLQKERLFDLSGTDYPTLFDSLTQKDYVHEGQVYLLPGPTNGRFFAYNATLFQEKGWKAPTTLSELSSLVKTIAQDSAGITPISFAGANVYANASFFEGLMQNYNLYRNDGFSWLPAYLAGTGSSAEGFDIPAAYLQSLSEDKAFDAADGKRWNGDIYSRFATQRKSAMLFVYNGQKDLDKAIASSSDRFGVFAMPGWHKNNYFLGIDSLASFGLSKRLGEKGNEKKLAAGLKVISYLSSAEGMDALSGSNNLSAYPLKGISNQNLSEFLKASFALGDSSIEARSLQLSFSDVTYSAGLALQKSLFFAESYPALSAEVDQWHKETLDGNKNEKYGRFAKDFSKEETAQFLANVIGASGRGDVGLVTLGQRQGDLFNDGGSSWGTIYQGPVKAEEINIPVPQDGDIITRPVNGATLIRLLEKGRKIVNNDKKSAYFPFYFSGVEAVWKEGKISRLSKNGITVDPEANYVLSYVGAGSLALSLSEIQDEGIAPLESVREIDTHLVMLSVYGDYLAKNSPIQAPTLSR